MTLLMSILFGPEVFWGVMYLASSWLAGRNVAPAYPVNNLLSGLYWYGPSAAVLLSYMLCLQWKIPGPPTWWLLVRLALAAAVGVCLTTNNVVEKIEAGSGRPGLAMGMMVAIFLHLLVIGGAAIVSIVVLVRSPAPAAVAVASPGGWQSFLTFVKQGAFVVAAVAGLILLVSFFYDRQTGRMSGEDKARRLSQAHGEKIGAKFAGEWRDGRKHWRNFEIEFVAPNSVRLTTSVEYGSERRKPRNIEAHLARWNGDVGAAFFEFIGAQRPWRASWDAAQQHMIWTVVLDMNGLSKSQFLNDTAEAARLYVGPLSGWAGTDTWWLFGEAIDAAIEAGNNAPEADRKRQFALAWLETAIAQTISYYERSQEFPQKEERLASLGRLRTEAREAARSGDAGAAKRLAANVRTVERWKEVAHAETDSAFLLNGSLRYLGLARDFLEKSP